MTTKPNKLERLKASLEPYRFLPRIGTLDLNNLTEDERFYLAHFGIYNLKLSPERFMLRLRLPAGRVSIKQLRYIVALAKENALDIILTSRAQMELHGLDAENVLELWKEVNAFGLTTWQTLSDNIRNIVTDVYDGRGVRSDIEAYPLILQMQERFLKEPDFTGMLPRRLGVAISGSRSNVSSFFGNDIYFALAEKRDLKGFNLYLGGKNSEMARNADIFVKPEDAVELFWAVVQAFNAYGARTTRAKTRLFHLLEEIGLERFRKHIAEFYAHELESSGTALLEKAPFETFEELRDGSYAFCYKTKFAEVTPDELLQLCDFAEAEGAEVRLSVEQHIHLLGLSEPKSPFENEKGAGTVVTCAGNRYCALALWSIKDEAACLPLPLIEKHRIRVGMSGCLKGCGRHHHADIGLVGLRSSGFGAVQKAARVLLGGEYTEGKTPARLIYSVVPLQHLNSLLETVIDEFARSPYEDFELFSRHLLNPFSTDFLATWFLAKLDTGAKAGLKPGKERALMEESFAGCDFIGLIGEDFHEARKFLSQRLWGVAEGYKE